MKDTILLSCDKAEEIYGGIKGLPVIDYHNHLSVIELKKNTRYNDIYDLWIAPDPYKHRAMRMCGVPEAFITGSASKKEKFRAWCKTFPDLIGNPLYIWSQTELNDVFGQDITVNEANSERIYEAANLFLAENAVTPEFFIKKYNVKKLCPCMGLNDDITDMKPSDTVVPSLRGDGIIAPAPDFIRGLEALQGKITSLEDFLAAVKRRIGAFRQAGCVFADHALDNGWRFYESDGKDEARFKKILNGEALTGEEKARLASSILLFAMNCYYDEKMTVQLHIGAQRFTSERLRILAGAAGGYAGIGNSVDFMSLTAFLNAAEGYGLPKTVLFTLNPADSEALGALAGSYSADNAPGLITLGPAWWWCDHIYGIKRTLEAVASFGLLSSFVGMTTDSRSLLSLARHDYFRRVLASFFAEKLRTNELPDENGIYELTNKMCFANAATLFEIK